MIYSFGEHELDTAIFELRRSGQTLPLRHLPFRLLVHLIRRRPAAVSKAELVREVGRRRTSTTVPSELPHAT